MLHGTFTAIITPFAGGEVDEPAFKVLTEHQLANGVHGLVPCGTTGESATLSAQERARVIALCVETVAGRRPVIAGCGSPATAEAIVNVRHAKAVGADAALVVTPYYNRPGQAGLLAHFRAIADAVELPLILYNVPSRTGQDLSVETVAALAAHPNIIGLKDATADLSRVARHAEACGPGFVLFSGDDPSQVGFAAQGGAGCISVTSNVAPGLSAALQEACLRGDFAEARAIDARLAPLHRALFLEPSPAPAKFACSLLGLCGETLRLPLVGVSEPVREAVRAAMRHAGVLAA